MRSLNLKAAFVIGCFVLALTFVAPPFIQGDEWNLATKFSINHQFEVPGMVLQPNTPYVIKLVDLQGNRNVVQIYNEDQTQMLTMFMGISSERFESTDETLFSFIETQPGFPLPMKEWFYPGRLRGLEFIYPKDQALKIAAHAKEPVLASDSTNLHDLASINVEAVGPVGSQAPAAATASNVTKIEETASLEEKPSVAEEPTPAPAVEENVAENENVEPAGEVAQSENEAVLTPEPEVQQPTEESEVAEAAQEEAPVQIAQNDDRERELPATAGELPLVALIGMICLGAGLGLKVLSAKS
jgi:hypothetical protein